MLKLFNKTYLLHGQKWGTVTVRALYDDQTQELRSVYSRDTRPGVSNEGWLYRREWNDPRKLRAVLQFIRNLKTKPKLVRVPM